MITHFREPKYRQPMGTAKVSLEALEVDEIFQSHPHFCTIWAIPEHQWPTFPSTKGVKGELTQPHVPKWQCHPSWVPGMHLLSSPACATPHSHRAQLCWGCSRTGGRFTRYPPEAWDKAAEEEESVSLDEGGEEGKGSIDCKRYDEALPSSQFISEAAQQDSSHHHS